MLKDTQHPDFSQLLDFVEAKTTTEQHNAVSHHLEVCAKCSARHQEAEQLLSLMKTDEAIDPPRDVLAMALNLFNGRTKQPSMVRRLVALLSFDSLTAAPRFGVRSSSSTSRQLLYSAEDTEIDLRVTEANSRWVLTGQILGVEECATGVIDLLGENISESTSLNDLCEFALPPVPPGDYKLTLHFSNVEVEVPRLELRS